MTDRQVTQEVAEVSGSGTAERQVTQEIAEVSGSATADRQVSQILLEVAFDTLEVAGLTAAGGGSQVGWRTCPRVGLTIDDVPVDVDSDWVARSTAFGGFDTFSGYIPLRQARRHPFSVDAGSPIRLVAHTGHLVWEGELQGAPRPTPEGRAELTARGPWIDAENAQDILVYQNRGAKLWAAADSDPYGYNSNDNYEIEGGTGKLQFKALKGEDYNSGTKAGFVIWLPGSSLKQIAFTINKNTDNSNFELLLSGATGPSGPLTDITTWTLGPANPSGTTKQFSWGANYDLLCLRIRASSNVTNLASVLRCWITNLRVNDRADGDDMAASDVVSDVGDSLGWNTDGVVSTSTNVLPLVWRDAWSDLLLYMADIEDSYVRVVGDEHLQFAPWGTETWEVLQGYSARPELQELEQFNNAVVRYTTTGGAPAEVSSRADPDPFPNLTRTIEYELPDHQSDTTLAQAVADRLVATYAKPRFAGRIEIGRARHPAGPLGILPGGIGDVSDWDLGMSALLRIHGVEHRYDGASLSIESPISLTQLIEESKRGLGQPRRPPSTQNNKH